MGRLFNAVEVAAVTMTPAPTITGWIRRGRYRRRPARQGIARYFDGADLMGLSVFRMIGADLIGPAFDAVNGFGWAFSPDGNPRARWLVLDRHRQLHLAEHDDEAIALMVGFGPGWLCDLHSLASDIRGRISKLP